MQAFNTYVAVLPRYKWIMTKNRFNFAVTAALKIPQMFSNVYTDNPSQKYWDNTLKWTHFWHPPHPPSMLRVFGQISTLHMIQPASSYMVEWSNIDGWGRREGASDIPSVIFCMVSRTSFAGLPQLLLARIVGYMN